MTRKIVEGSIYALIVALLLNLLLFWLGNNLSGPIEAILPGSDNPQAVPTINVILATTVPIILAGGGLLFLSRLREDFLWVGMWIIGIISLLSLVLPYVGTVNTASFATLGLMHTVVALAAQFCLINFVWSAD